MLAPRFVRTFQNIHRLRQILSVLAKHGFGHLVHKIGLRRLVPVRLRLAEPVPLGGSAAARRAVLALQELGPTFVKLGQMLATRPDIVPPEWIEELRTLHDRVAPFDTDLALERMEEELGQPVEALFAEFDRTPFAAGSIAQCYHATTLDGDRVVVKVQRPGIERIMNRDLQLLASLAGLAERHVPEYRIYRPVMIVEELTRTTRRELDLIGEAANTERFREDFKEVKELGVPRVHFNTTSRGVLTTDWLEGENLQALLDRGETSVNRKAVGTLISNVFLRQFFETGFFHADPHPGNLLVVPPDRVNILDFGMMGHLTDEMKDHLGTIVLALVARRLDVIVDVLQEIGAVGPATHVETLKYDIVGVLDKYYALPTGRIDLTQVFGELTEAARRNNAILPREFVMLGRSFVTVMAMAMRLDPRLNFREIVEPYAKRLILHKVSPAHVGRGLLVGLWQLGGILGRLPRDLRNLTRQALRGELQVTLEHRRLDDLMTEIDRASNRLSFAITIAAIIIASATIIKVDVGPRLFDVSLFGLLGFVIAGVMGLWLLVAILRAGRL